MSTLHQSLADTIPQPRTGRMIAKERLSQLLESGGYATQEAGYGPFAFGSDGHTYAARTARSLQREGRAELVWINDGRVCSWMWVQVPATKAAPEGVEG